MSRIVYSLTEAQYECLAMAARGQSINGKPRMWHTARTLEERGFLRALPAQDGDRWYGWGRFELMPAGRAVVDLANALQAWQDDQAKAKGGHDVTP